MMPAGKHRQGESLMLVHAIRRTVGAGLCGAIGALGIPLVHAAGTSGTAFDLADTNRDGSIDAFLAEREERRRRIGQTTFIFGRKLHS